jgi:hypothetical protein
MSNVNESDAPVVISPVFPEKRLNWSIEYDEHLRFLLNRQGIKDPDDQMMICDVLCAVGLAKYRMFGEDTDTVHSQEHNYTSTKLMRKIAMEL